MTEREEPNEYKRSCSIDDVGEILATASSVCEKKGHFNCPVIVVGSMKPCVGLGNLDLETKRFEVVDVIPPEVPPMEMRIIEGLPHKEIDHDNKGNSWLTFWFPGMKCQVSVTLQKNPNFHRPFTFYNWEVLITQMFENNNEIRYYGEHQDPDSVDFKQKQYFQVQDCRPSDSTCPVSILDMGGCTCNAKDPAYSADSRQSLSSENMQDIARGQLLFGKLCAKDQPTSSARVSFSKAETDSTMNTVFETDEREMTAETYYLNKIEKHSSILTYLTIYNTESRDFYTPMAARWFFDCCVRRVKNTDEFEWYRTTSSQRVPVPLTASQPCTFPWFPSSLLQFHCIRCRGHKDRCNGYATFNDSVSMYPPLPESRLHDDKTRI